MTQDSKKSHRVKKTLTWQEYYETFHIGDGMTKSTNDNKRNAL